MFSGSLCTLRLQPKTREVRVLQPVSLTELARMYEIGAINFVAVMEGAAANSRVMHFVLLPDEANRSSVFDKG